MSEKWLILLNTLTQRLIEDETLLDDPYPLIEEMVAEGYQHQEAEAALSWIGRFLSAPAPGSLWAGERFTSRGHRTRSAEEQFSFSREAFDYLMRLERLGLIDPPAREEILERALGTYEDEIGEEEIKFISRLVMIDHGLASPGGTDDPLDLIGGSRDRHLH